MLNQIFLRRKIVHICENWNSRRIYIMIKRSDDADNDRGEIEDDGDYDDD